MPRRNELAIGPECQQITDVTDECVGNGRCLNPCAGAVQHLQATKIILQQNRQHTKVSVGRGAKPLSLDIGLFKRRIINKLATAKRLVTGRGENLWVTVKTKRQTFKCFDTKGHQRLLISADHVRLGWSGPDGLAGVAFFGDANHLIRI